LTFLSLQSLAGRLAFSGFLLMLSLVGSTNPEADEWGSIATKLIVSGVFGGNVWLALGVLRPSSVAEPIKESAET
jgi:hypothetical protein